MYVRILYVVRVALSKYIYCFIFLQIDITLYIILGSDSFVAGR